MICTEKEAKEKWCPMVRSTRCTITPVLGERTVSGPVANREGSRLVGKCCASKCMMWVEVEKDKGRCGLIAAPTLIHAVPVSEMQELPLLNSGD
jgi:hypothetical protein